MSKEVDLVDEEDSFESTRENVCFGRREVGRR